MSKSILIAKNIHKKFIKRSFAVHVLQGIDLSLHEKESVALLGASGSGKSTLLHILGLLDRPTSGQLFLEGENMAEVGAPLQTLKRRHLIGFVFQKPHLLPELSVIENTMLPLLIQGQSRTSSFAEAEHMLRRVGLEHRMHFEVNRLSGGEQQRVSIARALIKSPKVLLADEPTGNLDHETGEMIFSLFLKLVKEQNTALLMVTHNHSLAYKLDRQLVLDKGLVREMGA